MATTDKSKAAALVLAAALAAPCEGLRQWGLAILGAGLWIKEHMK